MRVDHERKSDGVKVDQEKKSDGVRVDVEKKARFTRQNFFGTVPV